MTAPAPQLHEAVRRFVDAELTCTSQAGVVAVQVWAYFTWEQS